MYPQKKKGGKWRADFRADTGFRRRDAAAACWTGTRRSARETTVRPGIHFVLINEAYKAANPAIKNSPTGWTRNW